MNRYVSRHVPDESDDPDHEWLVEFEDGDRLFELTGLRDSIAHIIVFALEAIAQGRTLSRSAKPGDQTDADIIYSGPTDGVAP